MFVMSERRRGWRQAASMTLGAPGIQRELSFGFVSFRFVPFRRRPEGSPKQKASLNPSSDDPPQTERKLCC
jgi:hypothetical protein